MSNLLTGDLINTVAELVIETHNTSDESPITVKLLKYSEYACKLHAALVNRGYENVIHNVDGNIAVVITGETKKKVNLVNNWGHWTIDEKKPLRDGVHIEQGDESGILRFSHSSTSRGHGCSVDMQSWVIVTEDYRLVPLESGEAYIGE